MIGVGRWWNGNETYGRTTSMAKVWHKNAEEQVDISRLSVFRHLLHLLSSRKLPRVSDRTTTRSKLVNSTRHAICTRSQSDLKKKIIPRWPTPPTPLPRRRRPRRRCSTASSGTTSTAWSACTPRPPAIRPCRTRRSGAGRIGINLLVSCGKILCFHVTFTLVTCMGHVLDTPCP